ncbi:hypothetical protein POTOM_056274 [Populus tomentosa]|uniref:CpSecY n=1 Tax=Populus tomentosa TaxID=118781 RepID=A0A8X7XZL8_POPTO|nr:hypothetical protein POTOM_056274 [Populus tomentosa]
MLLTVREACPCSPISFNLSRINPTRASQRLKTSVCRASFSVQPKPNTKSWNTTLNANSFDPLGINSNVPSSLNASWESLLAFLSPIFESASSTKKDKRGVAVGCFDSWQLQSRTVPLILVISSKAHYQENFSSFWGFWLYPVLGYIYPLGGVNQEAFAENLDQNSLLSTLDSLSGGGIGRLGICSLGIVPFINAQIVFQLLAQIYPKLQDLQKREGEAGRKKIFQYTRHASVGFANSTGKQLNVHLNNAIGQVLYLRPYVDDFNTQWVLTSVTLLTLGSVFTTYIGERISDLKLGNGTSLLIFTSIISYLPASFGRTAAEAFQDGNYVGLGTIIFSFFLLVLGIVYVQHINCMGSVIHDDNLHNRVPQMGSSVNSKTYRTSVIIKVNSSGVMPIIFSTSSLALPGTLARFTGISALKKAALALNPGGSFYLPTNILLIAFFNYYYTFLQLDPDDVSEQLKRQGASIPLVRPGKSTAAFLKTVLSRISVLGSAFLAILAAGPSVIEQISHLTAFRGFAGTSVLILVGCATDTARKVQAEIISQKYKNIEFYDIDCARNRRHELPKFFVSPELCPQHLYHSHSCSLSLAFQEETSSDITSF